MTPFQATLQPASFRGVPFVVEEDNGENGRRGEVHEYWGRDVPYAEDGGRRARRIEVRGYVIGLDCAAQRDQLLGAVEQRGPGLLILPSRPPAMMQPDPLRPCRTREVWDKNLRIEFDLAFVEPGQLLYPTAPADTQAASSTAADDIGQAADQDLAEKTGTAPPGSGGSGSSGAPGPTTAGDYGGGPAPSIAEQAPQVKESDATPPPSPEAGAGNLAGGDPSFLPAPDVAPTPSDAAGAGKPTMDQPPAVTSPETPGMSIRTIGSW